MKTSSSKEVSFSSLENYCYALDNVSMCSDIVHSGDLHSVDGHVQGQHSLARDTRRSALRVQASVSLGNITADMSASEPMKFNYQSMAVRKVSVVATHCLTPT